MANTYQLISSNVLSSSAASVTFSAIPSTYTDLVLRCSVRTDSVSLGDYGFIRINGLTTGYHEVEIYGTGSAAGSQFNSTIRWKLTDTINGNGSTANTFSSTETYIPNYAGSTAKIASSFGTQEGNATAEIISAIASYNSTISGITTILVYSNSNWVAGSSFYLYGIKNS